MIQYLTKETGCFISILWNKYSTACLSQVIKIMHTLTCIICTLHRMSHDIQQGFISAEKTMHYNQGIWNGVWFNMFNETTHICYSHGPSIRHNWHHNQTRNTKDIGPHCACMCHTDHRPTRFGWQQIRSCKMYSQGGDIMHQGGCILLWISSPNPHQVHWSSWSWWSSIGFNHHRCQMQNCFSWSEYRWSSPNRVRSNENIPNGSLDFNVIL